MNELRWRVVRYQNGEREVSAGYPTLRAAQAELSRLRLRGSEADEHSLTLVGETDPREPVPAFVRSAP